MQRTKTKSTKTRHPSRNTENLVEKKNQIHLLKSFDEKITVIKFGSRLSEIIKISGIKSIFLKADSDCLSRVRLSNCSGKHEMSRFTIFFRFVLNQP